MHDLPSPYLANVYILPLLMTACMFNSPRILTIWNNIDFGEQLVRIVFNHAKLLQRGRQVESWRQVSVTIRTNCQHYGTITLLLPTSCWCLDIIHHTCRRSSLKLLLKTLSWLACLYHFLATRVVHVVILSRQDICNVQFSPIKSRHVYVIHLVKCEHIADLLL